MCWTPELVEFPCRWKSESSSDLETLGLEDQIEYEPGFVALDVKSITRVSDTYKDGESLIEINSTIWTISLSYNDIIDICSKCGVSFKKYSDILKEKPTKTLPYFDV